MRIFKTYFAWFMLAIALSTWGLVGFLAWRASGVADTRTSDSAMFEEESTKLESALRIRALARETESSRTRLESLVNQDVIAIVEAIEKVGTDAKVSLEIGQVLAETNADNEKKSTHEVTIAIDAVGSFARLMHAVSLLESLPVASSVEQIQLERLSDEAKEKAGDWRLVARIRVLTTANISS